MWGVFKILLKAKIICQNPLEPLVIWIGTIKSTNFRAVFIVERVVCGKSDGNIKHSHGQAWPTRIGIKLLDHLRAEKIARCFQKFTKGQNDLPK